MAANLLRKISGRTPTWLLKFLGNLWPPFFGAGIKIVEFTPDYHYTRICLKRRWYNTNYVGTQFGGSIYAMTDPFYMLMIINNLGRDYKVWDKAAKIDFIKPGLTNLYAEFRINDTLLTEIRARTANNEKYIFDLPVEIKDENNQIVATVIKTIYVRRKEKTQRGDAGF